jgi:predicted nucleic acid-binding protein
MSGRDLVLDSEAVSLLARRDVRLLPALAAAQGGDRRVLVPAIVLAELMTGRSDDAAARHVVNRLVVVDITGEIAARAGVLRERAEAVRSKKRDLTVDAIVAAVAADCAPSVLVTGDPGDMRLLTSGSDVTTVTPDGRAG